MLRNNRRGDTLVEVLLASAILALLLAGTYSLANRASRLNQASYERTQASNLLQEQAELLRAARDENGTAWTQILAVGGTSPYYDCRGNNSVNPEDHPNTGSFQLFNLEVDTTTGEIVVNSGASNRVAVDNYFHTFVNRTTGNGEYNDFYVYTCWPGIGTIGNQVAGLAVRLSQ